MKNNDELLQSPDRIIDILPAQVPKDSPGQCIAVEDTVEDSFSRIDRGHKDIFMFSSINHMFYIM